MRLLGGGGGGVVTCFCGLVFRPNLLSFEVPPFSPHPSRRKKSIGELNAEERPVLAGFVSLLPKVLPADTDNLGIREISVHFSASALFYLTLSRPKPLRQPPSLIDSTAEPVARQAHAFRPLPLLSTSSSPSASPQGAPDSRWSQKWKPKPADASLSPASRKRRPSSRATEGPRRRSENGFFTDAKMQKQAKHKIELHRRMGGKGVTPPCAFVLGAPYAWLVANTLESSRKGNGVRGKDLKGVNGLGEEQKGTHGRSRCARVGGSRSGSCSRSRGCERRRRRWSTLVAQQSVPGEGKRLDA